MTVRNFEHCYPTRMVFGPGVSAQSGQVLKSLGAARVLVLTDPGVAKAGLLNGILPSLAQAGLSHELFAEVGDEATLTQITAGLRVLKGYKPDIILSVGGGSVLDSGKALGCLATNPGPLSAYEGPEKYSIPPLPTVAVPTTAGTGSEVSFGGVIFDEQRRYKFSFRSSMQAPKVAVLDPLLLKNTPPRLAALAGLDALSHAVEAYVSKQAVFMTDAYCRQNFLLVGRCLRRFVADPSDVEAAGAMLQASSLGAMAFNVGRLGLVHAMAHPLGAHFHLPHGLACALLMPAVIRFNLMACPERYADMAVQLGEVVEAGSTLDRGAAAVRAIQRLLADLHIRSEFQSAPITDAKIAQMAEEAIRSGMHLTNPRLADRNDIMNIFSELFTQGHLH